MMILAKEKKKKLKRETNEKYERGYCPCINGGKHVYLTYIRVYVHKLLRIIDVRLNYTYIHI